MPETVVLIVGNGSHWAGEPESPIEELFARLETATLDPFWSPFGIQPRIAIRNPDAERWESNAWIEGPELIYPERPGIVRFQGNFIDYSHGFCIDTDDPEMIERLRAACSANLARHGNEAGQ